jgi:hypothetical protein
VLAANCKLFYFKLFGHLPHDQQLELLQATAVVQM